MHRSVTPHWPSRVGFGAAFSQLPNPFSRPDIDAANGVLDYFANNLCSQASIATVAAFQSAYNTSGLPGLLSVDGQYGGNTQRALQNVMDRAQADAGAGPSQSSPPSCFAAIVEPAIPTTDPSATPTTPVTPATPATPAAPPSGKSWTPWLVGGALALGAGGIALAIHQRR